MIRDLERKAATWRKKKVSPEENMISIAVQKAFYVVLAVSRCEVA